MLWSFLRQPAEKSVPAGSRISGNTSPHIRSAVEELNQRSTAGGNGEKGFFPRLFGGGEARLNPGRDKVGDLWKLGNQQTHHGYADKTRKPHPKIEA
jgi:hypothetical protein